MASRVSDSPKRRIKQRDETESPARRRGPGETGPTARVRGTVRSTSPWCVCRQPASGTCVRRRTDRPLESLRTTACQRRLPAGSTNSGGGAVGGQRSGVRHSVRAELDAANVRRAFRKVVAAAGLEASKWTPRELRHSVVSLLPSAGVPIEDIAHPVGHASTRGSRIGLGRECLPACCRSRGNPSLWICPNLLPELANWGRVRSAATPSDSPTRCATDEGL